MVGPFLKHHSCCMHASRSSRTFRSSQENKRDQSRCWAIPQFTLVVAYWFYSSTLPSAPKCETRKNNKFHFCEMSRNKWHRTKVLHCRFNLNCHNLRFHLQIQKLEHHVQDNKQHHKKVLDGDCHINGHTFTISSTGSKFGTTLCSITNSTT